MTVFPIALSLLASFFSATSLLGNPAEIYIYGIQYIICIFGMMVVKFFFYLAKIELHLLKIRLLQ